MAQPTEFVKVNYKLGSGNNENTNDMPVSVSVNPSTPNNYHYVSRWKFSEDEKEAFRERVRKAIDYNPFIKGDALNELLDSIVEAYDHVWLAVMHTPVPTLILAEDPFEQGYVNVSKHLLNYRGNDKHHVEFRFSFSFDSDNNLTYKLAYLKDKFRYDFNIPDSTYKAFTDEQADKFMHDNLMQALHTFELMAKEG